MVSNKHHLKLSRAPSPQPSPPDGGEGEGVYGKRPVNSIILRLVIRWRLEFNPLVRPAQPLLFADPRPLVERLGGDFFREAPKRAGVYLMRDANDRVLYVGKAKNLRQRLRNYRIANPDQMPRRHLRMVREVTRIEFQLCPGESAALKHESKLLRSLKPKFNRAGVWPGKTKFLVWRTTENILELAVTDVPETGWHRVGPLRASAIQLHATFARLLWLAVNEDKTISELPRGWAQGSLAERIMINCGALTDKITTGMETFFWSGRGELLAWVESLCAARIHPFERGAIAADLEVLKEFSVKARRNPLNRSQLALL